MNGSQTRISFGMIVLNGLPFLHYNLLSIYSFAHEIIVVEGACTASAEVCSPDGHSNDGTLGVLRKFKEEEDPENKLIIVAAEDEGRPDGFWLEKKEMSQAYAKRITGDYLWQIDVDEFYQKKDMQYVVNMLSKGDITAISFPFYNFWGGTEYILDGYSDRREDRRVNRIFKWSPGSSYVSHRPPTVQNADWVDMASINWLDSRNMKRRGIFMYHYDMILPVQAFRKSRYYSKVEWHQLEGDRVRDWYRDIFEKLRDPYHIYTIYTHFSWLRKFDNEHPEVVKQMLNEIGHGKFPGIELRRTNDIESLLNDWRYRLGCCWRLWLVVLPQTWLWSLKMRLRSYLIMIGIWGVIQSLRRKSI